jgi:Complex I intermediate-associated protein 30 (CIA30)
MTSFVRVLRRIFPTARELLQPVKLEDKVLYDMRATEGMKVRQLPATIAAELSMNTNMHKPKSCLTAQQWHGLSCMHVAQGWATASDSAAGGRSTCSVAWHDEEDGFMRFSGNVSGVLGHGMARSGFCATRSPKVRSCCCCSSIAAFV